MIEASVRWRRTRLVAVETQYPRSLRYFPVDSLLLLLLVLDAAWLKWLRVNGHCPRLARAVFALVT